MDIKSLKPKEKSFGKKSSLKNVILIVVILAVILGGCYIILDKLGYVKVFKYAASIVKQTNLNAEDKKILEQLGKIILLPDNEVPTMAIIKDVDNLRKTQPGFFTNAKNGDRLIVYSQASMAIVFDPVANKILKVGPVQYSGNQQQTQVQQVPFAIYNSTSVEAKTEAMAQKITSIYNNAVVTIKEKAVKIDYPQTLVVDLLGNNPEIEKIAQAIGGIVSALPDGEPTPEGAAVLVIIGKQ